MQKKEIDEELGEMGQGYLSESAYRLWRRRIPWLLVLMVSATVSGAILTRFEAVLPSILLVFVPMLMDTGGNCGAQASVAVIRAISVGEAGLAKLPQVLRKECAVGLFSGVTLGVAAFIKVLLVDRVIMNNTALTVSVAACIAASVALVAFASKIIGALLPMIAKRLGLDPAVMSSPLITTLVDAVALLIYFFISFFFLAPII